MNTGLLVMDLRVWLDKQVIAVSPTIWHCQHCNRDGAAPYAVPHHPDCPVWMMTQAVTALEYLTGESE